MEDARSAAGRGPCLGQTGIPDAPQDATSTCAPPPLRAYKACVFCAMQQWSENLTDEYLAGPQCTIPSKGLVAQLLFAEWCASQWPLIPREELMASAVDLPHEAQDGSCTTTKVLMHKRRVSADALAGTDTVCVCASCKTAVWRQIPLLLRFSLANLLSLGRHHPLFQRTSIGHQLLLALGRVASTKV